MTQLAVNSLKLMGTFHILHHGEHIDLRQPRLEELIALLAVHPGVPYTPPRSLTTSGLPHGIAI